MGYSTESVRYKRVSLVTRNIELGPSLPFSSPDQQLVFRQFILLRYRKLRHLLTTMPNPQIHQSRAVFCLR